MLVVAVITALSLCAAEDAPAVGRSDDAWRHVKIGKMNIENVSICELTAELSEKADFPIHLICTNWTTPQLPRFQLPEDATLGQAFDTIRKSVPELRAKNVGTRLIWNSLGDAPFTRALERRLDSKLVSGTLDDVMNEVFGEDFKVAGSPKLPNSRVNGDALHIHLRSTGTTPRLDALVVAAEDAEARITLFVGAAENLLDGDARSTLICVGFDFARRRKVKKE